MPGNNAALDAVMPTNTARRAAVVKYDDVHGTAWETFDSIHLLDLTRKDEPGANFFGIITMGDGGDHRARTWQWFRQGRLFRRTSCDEVREGGKSFLILPVFGEGDHVLAWWRGGSVEDNARSDLPSTAKSRSPSPKTERI